MIYMKSKTPLMSEVFLLEASMHAWKNLGYTHYAKDYLEKSTKMQFAYEFAIAVLPIVAKETDPARPGYIDAHIIDNMLMFGDEDNITGRLLKQLQFNKKLQAALRSRASEIKKLGDSPEAFALVNKLLDENAPDAPEGYDKAEVFLELDGGWKWVEVGEQDCQSHEGSLMQHCGGSHQNMLSLRDSQGKPHVTADVNPTIGWVGQIKGKQNAPVAEKYWEMCGELFKYLKKINGGRKPEFEDPMYMKSPAGIEFMEYLKEFGFAKIFAPNVSTYEEELDI